MQSIIECDNCGYSRSSEQDGRMFYEVCAICYLEDCMTPVGDAVLCSECNADEALKHQVPVIDPGESLFT